MKNLVLANNIIADEAAYYMPPQLDWQSFMIVLGKGIFLKFGSLKVIKSDLILYTYISQQKLRCDSLTEHPPTDDRNK